MPVATVVMASSLASLIRSTSSGGAVVARFAEMVPARRERFADSRVKAATDFSLPATTRGAGCSLR